MDKVCYYFAHMRNTIIAVLAGLSVAAAPVITSEKIDPEINAKIRAEADWLGYGLSSGLMCF
jgi:hypothetical protein